MSRFALHASRFFLPAGVAPAGYLLVQDDTILGYSEAAPEGADVVELGDVGVAPGFVDTHIHGYAGHDVMDCDPAGVHAITQALLREGTTSWLATTLTASVDQTREAVSSVKAALESQPEGFLGTRTQGIFLEGPFFSYKYKGAQNPKYLIDPEYSILADWQTACGGIIKKSALAPERDGSLEYVREAVASGVVAAIGHTDATYAQALAAVNAGASVFVHTYNAMRPLAHRDPGVVGCAMVTKQTYSELICDGQHLVPAAAKALINAKGASHVFAVSDSLMCGGLADGDYMIGELPIAVVDGLARLKNEDGTPANIAGSTTTIAKEVKNLVSWGIVTPEEAVRMGTEIPAIANGIADKCGSILPGRLADLVVLAPDMELRGVYLGGREVNAA